MKKLLSILAVTLFAASAFAAQLTLTWDDNSTTESGFEIDRALSPSLVFTTLPRVAANVTTFVDASLANNTGYTYRVRAFQTVPGGELFSAWSNMATATTYPAPPAAPGNLKVTPSGLTLLLRRGESVNVIASK